MQQLEFELVVSRINMSLVEMWRQSYALAKKKTPTRLDGESYEQLCLTDSGFVIISKMLK